MIFNNTPKNNTIHDLPGGPITEFGTDETRDIHVADGNTVAVGIAIIDPDYKYSYETAFYWLNGELHYHVNRYDVPENLNLGDWEHRYARGVHIE